MMVKLHYSEDEEGNLRGFCDLCERPMEGAFLAMWTENEAGTVENYSQIHYECREFFEANYYPRKEWLSRGYPDPAVYRRKGR